MKNKLFGNNTWKENKEFKNYKFSEGEDLTDKDIEVIKARSTGYYTEDKEYESWARMEDFSSRIFVKFEENEIYDEENTFED